MYRNNKKKLKNGSQGHMMHMHRPSIICSRATQKGLSTAFKKYFKISEKKSVE